MIDSPKTIGESEMISYAYNLIPYLEREEEREEDYYYSLSHHQTFLKLRRRLSSLNILPADLEEYATEKSLKNRIKSLAHVIKSFQERDKEYAKTRVSNKFIERDDVQPYEVFVNSEDDILFAIDADIPECAAYRPQTLWTDNLNSVMIATIKNPQKIKIVNPKENFPYGTACFNIVKISSDQDAETPIIAFESVKAILDVR